MESAIEANFAATPMVVMKLVKCAWEQQCNFRLASAKFHASSIRRCPRNLLMPSDQSQSRLVMLPKQQILILMLLNEWQQSLQRFWRKLMNQVMRIINRIWPLMLSTNCAFFCPVVALECERSRRLCALTLTNLSLAKLFMLGKHGGSDVGVSKLGGG